MSILISVLLVFHVFLCLLMVLVVLMQRPRSEGLGAAFGGGVADNLFGAQTTHVLQKFTVYLGAGFFILTLLLAILYSKAAAGTTSIQRELLASPPAATTPATEPAAEVSSTATPVPNEIIEIETPAASPNLAAPEQATETAAPQDTANESSSTPAPEDIRQQE